MKTKLKIGGKTIVKMQKKKAFSDKERELVKHIVENEKDFYEQNTNSNSHSGNTHIGDSPRCMDCNTTR